MPPPQPTTTTLPYTYSYVTPKKTPPHTIPLPKKRHPKNNNPTNPQNPTNPTKNQKPQIKNSILPLLLLLTPLLLQTTACTGYRLGPPTNQHNAQTVTIHPIQNQTPEPALTPALTAALRRQLQNDATYTLDTRNQGHIHLTGTITHYQRIGITSQPNDTITPRDFQIQLTAQIKAHNHKTGKTIFNRPFTGRTLLRAFDNLPNAERQALPQLANDLARQTIDLLTHGDW